MSETLLHLEDLKIYFPLRSRVFSRTKGYVKGVDGIDLNIAAGETLGLVGESGSGKTTLGRSIVCLLKPFAGTILFKGENLLTQSGKDLRKLRRHLQMVFQDPYGSLNPRRTVSSMLEEAMRIHRLGTRQEIQKRVQELLSRVGLPREASRRYPHEFSGGQRQRLSIARALSVNPEFIVLDEPVSALDVSMQAQILNLLKELQSQFNLTYLFIAHDLGVVKHMSNRIAVMYLGRIMEIMKDGDIDNHSLHPYTVSLLSSVPKLEDEAGSEKIILQGDIPSPIHLPDGCRFHTRCYRATEECSRIEPELYNLGDGHKVACLHYRS
jgi:oligopeptide/dipeptide ABC transporter ATP-binding protein